MTKPTVFCYKDYTDLKAKYTDLLYKFARLKDEKTNLEIRCRILEADLEQLKAESIPVYKYEEIKEAMETLCGTERVKREDVIGEASE